MSDFKGRHFRGEIVLWAVRWYCRYPISYRDLEAMMTERGVAVDHSTIYRWVQRFAPEMEKRLRRQWRRRLCCKLGEGAMRNQGASCSPYDSALARRSCSHAMASVRAHGPRPKARSTIRASPTMPPWRANIPAWPLRSARITSKPLIVA